MVLGVNVDDLGDHRPGQRAASERGAAFPLVDAGFTKSDVRAWSRRLGLRTWDKPAAACLASRLPYGTPVTLGRLATVERAEAALRSLGFRELRVRHYGDTARLEVPLDRLADVVALRERVVAAVQGVGLPLRDAGSRGTAVGQPQRRARPRRRDGRRDLGQLAHGVDHGVHLVGCRDDARPEAQVRLAVGRDAGRDLAVDQRTHDAGGRDRTRRHAHDARR